MQKPIIQFGHVSRRFGGRDVLKDIDLQVPAGIIAGLVGPNGSGKTTLLKLMEYHEKQPGLEDVYIRRLHEASDHSRPSRNLRLKTED